MKIIHNLGMHPQKFHQHRKISNDVGFMGHQIISLLKTQVINLYRAPKIWPSMFPEEYFIGQNEMEVSKID